MSQWDPNHRRPFEQGQDGYDEIFYNNSSLNITNPFYNQNGFYSYDQQFAQNYNVPMSACNAQGDGDYTTNLFYMPQHNADFRLNNDSNTNTMAQASGQITSPAFEESNAQAQSATVINSNLTPLAKEFTPSTSSVPTNTFYDDRNKRQGAIKKGTYWNRDKRPRNENRQYSSNYEGSENKTFRQNNESARENTTTKNREYYKSSQTSNFRNNFKDFNKSTEQSKILQETKRFLEQVKNVPENKTKDGELQPRMNSLDINEPNNHNNFARNNKNVNRINKDFTHKNDFTYYEDSRFNAESDGNKFNKHNSYYGKSNYNNRNRNYKNTYRKEYNNEYENRSKEYQAYDRRHENDNKGRNHQGADRRRENENQGNDIKFEIERKKAQNDAYERKKSGFQNLKKKLDAASQRERLEQLVVRRLLECLVCCEKLRHTDQIWSCKQCFHILHLQCVRRWAQSSKLEAGWRCPACQNVYQDVPNEYRCYCTKQVQPPLEPGGVPHSCGDVCGRKGRSCSHTCTLICHPGPCPDCTVMVPRSCGCGATKPIVKCSSTVPVTCQKVCEKVLECGLHNCDKKCHEGSCGDCTENLKQECYCGKEGRKVKCSAEVQGATAYECGELCGKILSCGNHKCELSCHAGPCDSCALAPDQIITCNCGQTKLTQLRNSCLDPVPCCDKICNKKLLCGQPSAPHLCKVPCHEGLCPPCSRTTIIRCRCGHMDKELPCAQVTTKADDARCEKKCTKKRLCGKHKCNQLCCIEVDHICPLPCNRLLSCGQHRCEAPCHKGRCPPCWRTSFEELYCECGCSVLYPPVACGTRPPPCDQLCSRPRPCGHEVLHTCHTGPCPPCTVLSKRWCHGHHEQRATIPCHQENFSCGLPCGRDMICGKHKCVQPCHEGPCRTPCTQPCTELRPDCGHPCNQRCHAPPCPETACKQQVKVTCQCGLRKSSRVCMELSGEYQNIAMSQLASKMEEMQLGHAVDITDIVSGQKKGTLKTLECNDECRLVERNRRLAIGLQIRNPDLSAKLTPRYSDYMRNWAKKDTKFCKYVHDKLTELVQLAKQSKQKSRSYSFETMNRDKRHFVHEYCEHFGCDSAAYDPEPHRNVVATAFKDKSWLPSYSLLEVIQRESGQRKVPGPQQLGKGSASKSEAVSLKLPGRIPRPATPPGEYVDYFNNPPE